MDVKQELRKAYIICFYLIFLACEKIPTKAVKVIDDSNSEFTGKTCYGKAINNQYLITLENGEQIIHHGDYASLESILSTGLTKEGLVIRRIEQDRNFNLKSEIEFDSKILIPNAKTQSSTDFWQVWGQADVEANLLWELGFKGDGVTIALIDGGVDQSHPSLAERIYTNEDEIPNNGLDDDQNGLIDDFHGFDFAEGVPEGSISYHGTHVAGIMVAEPQGGPMLGVAPKAKILPLNIMGPRGGGSMSAAVFAIKYAQSRGVKIINASWGGSVCSDSLKESINELGGRGILFVSAAGNDGFDIETYPEFPAAFNLANQITVGASVPSGLMASFSNYGTHKVHILAPGHQILSTVPGGWQVASGTSMAAPFVSGVAALLWGAFPNANHLQIRSAILASVVEPKNYHPVLARGRINALKGLRELEQLLK